MIGIKPLLRVVSLLAVAMAAGQLVETQRLSADRAQPKSGGVQADAVEPSDFRALIDITPVAATPDARVGDSCAASMQLPAMPGAMVDVALATL